MAEDPELTNFADNDDELDTPGTIENYREAVLYGTDWTVKTLLQQIVEGNIDLAPNFQRRDAWPQKNKSRFIESVILQLPIPQIVLAERKEQRGTYIVLDGKQRLLTLAQFAGDLPADHPLLEQSRNKGKLKLSNLKIVSEVNGKTYSDFSHPDLSNLKTQFDNHTIRSSLIRNWPDEDYLYELFIRLNTGSSRLSPQELRQALKPGPFTEFLNTFTANSDAIKSILGTKAPDFRMRDTDLLLRMLAFLTYLENYTGNLKPFLDSYHEMLNSNWAREEQGVIQLCDRIERAIYFLSDAFGDPRRVGRRWKDGSYEGPINRAVMDIQLAAALDTEVILAQRDGRLDIESEFKKLCENSREFVESIAGTTKSIHSINIRYSMWKHALANEINEAITFPRMP